MIITKWCSHVLSRSSWIQDEVLLPSPFLRATGNKFATKGRWCKGIKRSWPSSLQAVLYIVATKPPWYGGSNGNSGKCLLKLKGLSCFVKRELLQSTLEKKNQAPIHMQQDYVKPVDNLAQHLCWIHHHDFWTVSIKDNIGTHSNDTVRYTFCLCCLCVAALKSIQMLEHLLSSYPSVKPMYKPQHQRKARMQHSASQRSWTLLDWKVIPLCIRLWFLQFLGVY